MRSLSDIEPPPQKKKPKKKQKTEGVMMDERGGVVRLELTPVKYREKHCTD